VEMIFVFMKVWWSAACRGQKRPGKPGYFDHGPARSIAYSWNPTV
jgi:hypothetical protein